MDLAVETAAALTIPFRRPEAVAIAVAQVALPSASQLLLQITLTHLYGMMDSPKQVVELRLLVQYL
jgi:hypothetical protein